MKEGQLRVWWSNEVPIVKYEHYIVINVLDAIFKIEELTARDLEDSDVTDNIGGLERYEEDEDGNLNWSEFYNGRGRDIMEIIDELKEVN